MRGFLEYGIEMEASGPDPIEAPTKWCEFCSSAEKWALVFRYNMVVGWVLPVLWIVNLALLGHVYVQPKRCATHGDAQRLLAQRAGWTLVYLVLFTLCVCGALVVARS